MKAVGFTGSSRQITQEQHLAIHQLVGDFKTLGATEAHHGMCVKGDEIFDYQVTGMHYTVIGHPGVLRDGRAFKRSRECQPNVVLPEKWMLDRNKDIVEAADVMIATPASTTEEFAGSGTWMTIRYTRMRKKPLFIVWPDGSMRVEVKSGIYEVEDISKLEQAWLKEI